MINLENLDYFIEFNNKKKCKFYEGEKEPIILEDIDSKLKEIFKNEFEEKIKEREINFNLFSYDMIQIFNNYPYNFSVTDYDEFSFVFFVEPQKIKVEENDINLDLQKNSINIKYFNLTGIYEYHLLPEMYFNFVMECQKDKDHFIYERNENGTNMEFIISDCQMSDNNYRFQSESPDCYIEIKKILQDYYINYLKESAEKYYKDIFD